MSRYNSDAIDECCEEMLGHTNWGYIDTFTESQMKMFEKNDYIYRAVVFFNEPCEEEEE